MRVHKPRPRAMDNQGREIDRRKAVRLEPSQIPALKSARLVAGPEVKLINLSSSGALLESSTRILPGTGICIRLVATDATFLLRGRVLQSRASSLHGSELIYECRIALDEEFSLLSLSREEHPTIDEESVVPLNENAAGVNEHWPEVLEDEVGSTLTVTIPVPQLERDLRQVFGL